MSLFQRETSRKHPVRAQDFAAFGDFFGEKLQNGVLLEDEFGVKLVGFHPQYEEEPLPLAL